MIDTITLPREVVEKAIKAFENGCPPTCENGMIDSGGFHPWGEPMLDLCPACLAFEHLRTHLAAEPTKTPAWWRDGLAATLMREGVNKHRAREIAVGYWEAYCQIPGNETEADVLRDIGLVRITDGTVETADIHAIVDRQEALRRDAEQFRWMRENAISVDTVADPDGLVQVWVGTDPAKCFYGRTLDAAIVSAMAGSET